MKKTKQTKAGQINSLPMFIILLVVAGAILVLGLIMLQEIRNIDIIGRAESGNVTNETLTTVTESGEILSSNANANCIASVEIVINASSNTEIDSTNFTVTGCTVSVSSDDSIFNNTDWNVTYSFTFGGQAFISANDTLVGIGTFADFFTIIVLAVVITIVIGLLIGLFGGRRVR